MSARSPLLPPRLNKLLFVTALGLGLLAGPLAHAEGVDQPSTAPTKSERWYGWQTLTVDGALLAVGFLPNLGSTDASKAALGAGWYGAYSIGAPIVHWAHGHVGKGFASLGMRLVGPWVGGALGGGIALATGADFGATATNGDRLWNGTGDILIAGGVVAGLIAPIVIDAALLAREPARVERTASANGVRLTGGSIVLRGGGGFTAGGTF